jgi:hypothetical protein
MFGAWFVLWRRERQAILRGRADVDAKEVTILSSAFEFPP